MSEDRRDLGRAWIYARWLAIGLLGLLSPGCELVSVGDVLLPDRFPSPVSISRPGVFFRPVRGESVEEIRLPLTPQAPYRRLDVSFDMELDRWHSPLFHSVVALRRKGGPLYFGLLLRASNRRTIIDRGDHTEIKRDGPWQEGERYSIFVTYDVWNGTLSFRALNRGREVQSFTDRISHRDLRDDGQAVLLVLGQRQVADGTATGLCTPSAAGGYGSAARLRMIRLPALIRVARHQGRGPSVEIDDRMRRHDGRSRPGTDIARVARLRAHRRCLRPSPPPRRHP